ncbi:MAG: DNA-directed RNA polymerase specialized sigma24 family protein [Verrucomicrobiales bacterium]|jgi:DNA-directed RNA polymerase specialized sigma24 family protein
MAEEWELVQGIVSGDTKAGDRFAIRFRDSLVSWLCSKCDAPDGRSREQAVEVVDNLLAECVAGNKEKEKPPLLTKFAGKGSLEGWLRRSARCRLISWWRSLAYRSERTESTMVTEDNDQPLATRFAADAGPDTEEAVAEVLKDALHYSFNEVAKEETLGLVFLRLATLHGIQKQRLAQAWQRDPAQAGRRIAKALDIVRTRSQEYVRAVDPFLKMEWEDYLKVFEKYPRLLHGDA